MPVYERQLSLYWTSQDTFAEQVLIEFSRCESVAPEAKRYVPQPLCTPHLFPPNAARIFKNATPSIDLRQPSGCDDTSTLTRTLAVVLADGGLQRRR